MPVINDALRITGIDPTTIVVGPTRVTPRVSDPQSDSDWPIRSRRKFVAATLRRD
jgi:hypothetical protein